MTSSYKIMKALGRYKVDIPTGQHYLSGMKKGEPKYKKEWREDGVKGILDWAIQLNYYRILLEKQGLTVKKMVIQAMCRDNSLRIANERGIDQAVYLIQINRISDHWIISYLRHKAKLLKTAMENETVPRICSSKERWNDRKCNDYCQVAENCAYGRRFRRQKETAKDAS